MHCLTRKLAQGNEVCHLRRPDFSYQLKDPLKVLCPSSIVKALRSDEVLAFVRKMQLT